MSEILGVSLKISQVIEYRIFAHYWQCYGTGRRVETSGVLEALSLIITPSPIRMVHFLTSSKKYIALLRAKVLTQDTFW